MPLPSIFRIPRPKTFLYLMSLRTGTELVTLSLLLNKVSGLYGILALLTGFHLSPLQLSMYIYSLAALALLCYLAPHIRQQSPLQCLALAWFYIFDSLINATYTALFGLSWFAVLAAHVSDSDAPASDLVPGGSTVNDTAGFTSPKYNVSKVDVIATPAAGVTTGQDAVAFGTPASATISSTLGSAVFQSGSITSISVISALWAVRLYFVLIVLAYARGVLRQHILATGSAFQPLHTGSDSAELAENPFRNGRVEGVGWQGRLGRAMVAVGRGYWFGKDDSDEWVRGVGGKFGGGGRKLDGTAQRTGVGERERRARSGTGPPPLRVAALQEVR
ncbi:hypothetical protein B0A49_04819 [Cryomyces minteri]|uniref:Inositol phoshorylceramide synthase regulatory subunit kei1 n=1 Tax=Cryomyces minteri TaxID=331657 RepID=A0A4U0XHZ7_9PEZI|nr:hypothetical protein B0A49_04819 [Cryomyces minteri]